jgi:hypothetical protein
MLFGRSTFQGFTREGPTVYHLEAAGEILRGEGSRRIRAAPECAGTRLAITRLELFGVPTS